MVCTYWRVSGTLTKKNADPKRDSQPAKMAYPARRGSNFHVTIGILETRFFLVNVSENT